MSKPILLDKQAVFDAEINRFLYESVQVLLDKETRFAVGESRFLDQLAGMLDKGPGFAVWASCFTKTSKEALRGEQAGYWG